MNLLQQVQQQFHTALMGLVDDPQPYVAMVRAAQEARFGDYQANCAMGLAKKLGRPPRDVAQEIVRRLPAGELFEPPEIAGPGFINVRLRKDWLADQLRVMARDERLGVAPAQPPRTVVIDFSSPNVAKPMHVGHLRSTIIGDALARLFRFLGHRVITDNHLGDWGRQFGMLLYGYKHFRDEEALRANPVAEMVRLYVKVRQLIKPAEAEEESCQEAQQRYGTEELAHSREVLQAVRQETARLHAGEAENLRLWQEFMPWCLEEIQPVYRRLDIHFDHTLGESFYNPMLPEVVQSLEEHGLAEPSEGGLVIFGQEEVPAIVRKRDGAFTYTTTDLATVRYRIEQWRPDLILYVVGAPQALHFRQLFDIVRRWGESQVQLEHIPFGNVLSRTPDGKVTLFRTSEGDTIGLVSLLDEAIVRAAQMYERTRAERRERGEEVPELSQEEISHIAEVVGLGAVKYADLSQNRTTDYVFSWDKMLAMEGNTSAYMQYAYARIRSIFRKGEEDSEPLRREPPPVLLDTAPERTLALQLLRLQEVLEAAANDYQPSLIAAYLWDLAKSYSGFHQKCRVLQAETPELRQSRLLLCDLTARVIHKGLDLLGIRTVERM